MNTDEIASILSNDAYVGPVFGGCVSSDMLCEMVPARYPCAYVCNYDPSDRPGTHWVAVYLTEDRRGEFFDSYGMVPMLPVFVDFLRRNTTSWTVNSRQLQGLTSTVCGQYCVFYLLHRCRGWKMDVIVNLFEKDTRENDEAVFEFVQNMLF